MGERAVHPLLVNLQTQAPQARCHLMGHSFGCIVMTAAITGPLANRRIIDPSPRSTPTMSSSHTVRFQFRPFSRRRQRSVGRTRLLFKAPALVMAIMCGLRFAAASPATAPHIEYHIRHVIPGVTYLESCGDISECAESTGPSLMSTIDRSALTAVDLPGGRPQCCGTSLLNR